MKFLEKDLEDIIWETDNKILREKGLDIRGKIYRQLRIGNYGIADLVTFDKSTHVFGKEYGVGNFINVTVYELKKEKIGVSAFLQALGYLKGIERYLKYRNKNITFYYNIILIGKEIDTNSTFTYLPEFLLSENCIPILSNYTYDYGVNGIEFNNHRDYKLIDEGFNL